MRALTSAFALLVLLFSASSFAAPPVQDLIDVPISVNVDGSTPKIEQIRAAIISGARKRGWTPVLGSDGKITASILVRSTYYAEVEIPYTAKTYSILYKNSRELDFDEKKRTIHRNYNKWVALLSSTIQQEFGVNSQKF